jgi:type IV pilus assembly protein PilQ
MMNAHDRRNVSRLWAFALPCAIATWTLFPAPPAEAQFFDEAESGAEATEQTESVLGDEDVSVSDFMEVTLHVQDTELVKVLQMLSIQSQKNIITSPSVSAMVSADLYDVSFYEALDALLHVNGYGYQEKGNFIYVYTQEELAAMEEAAREPVTRVLDLNYINAADASVFVTPALSDIGQIALNGPVQQGIEPSISNAGQNDWVYSGKLVVRDYPENVEEIERIIGELDTRPSQVLVEATIMQTTLTEENAFGVDFSIIADVNFVDFITGPLGTTDSLRLGGTPGGNGVIPSDNRGTGITSTVGNTGGAAGFKVGVVHDDFSVFMRLLDEVTDSVILSNPKILCLNRQRAHVQVGRNIGYLSTTATDTSTTQTVEFLPTGTTLTFRPFITNDGMIRMELAPRVSEGIIRDVTNATGATVTIPDEITQELTTNVLVRDGNTIVLGGLFRETTHLTKRQVPFLGDLPLLGPAFRGHEDQTDRTEIVFMVRPTIINDAVLVDQAERAAEYNDLARTGIRRALLPWSEERLSAQWNQDALEFAQQGDLKKASWALERSLAINPTQPRALELREKLRNERDRIEMPSILEDIYDDSHEQLMQELEDSLAAAKVEQASQFQQALADMDRLWYEQHPEEHRPLAGPMIPKPNYLPNAPRTGAAEFESWDAIASALADVYGVHMRWIDGPIEQSCPLVQRFESTSTFQFASTDENTTQTFESNAWPQDDDWNHAPSRGVKQVLIPTPNYTPATPDLSSYDSWEAIAVGLAEVYGVTMRWRSRFEPQPAPLVAFPGNGATFFPEATDGFSTGEESDFFDSK